MKKLILLSLLFPTIAIHANPSLTRKRRILRHALVGGVGAAAGVCAIVCRTNGKDIPGKEELTFAAICGAAGSVFGGLTGAGGSPDKHLSAGRTALRLVTPITPDQLTEDKMHELATLEVGSEHYYPIAQYMVQLREESQKLAAVDLHVTCARDKADDDDCEFRYQCTSFLERNKNIRANFLRGIGILEASERYKQEVRQKKDDGERKQVKQRQDTLDRQAIEDAQRARERETQLRKIEYREQVRSALQNDTIYRTQAAQQEYATQRRETAAIRRKTAEHEGRTIALQRKAVEDEAKKLAKQRQAAVDKAARDTVQQEAAIQNAVRKSVLQRIQQSGRNNVSSGTLSVSLRSSRSLDALASFLDGNPQLASDPLITVLMSALVVQQ